LRMSVASQHEVVGQLKEEVIHQRLQHSALIFQMRSILLCSPQLGRPDCLWHNEPPVASKYETSRPHEGFLAVTDPATVPHALFAVVEERVLEVLRSMWHIDGGLEHSKGGIEA
jgi:hypothetical protein